MAARVSGVGEPLLAFSDKQESWGCFLGRKVVGVAALAATAATVAGRVLLSGSRWASTLWSFGVGASMQTAAAALLPPRVAHILHQLEERNAMALLFLLSNVSFNVDNKTAEVILGDVLTGFAGLLLATKVARIVFQRLADIGGSSSEELSRPVSLLFHPHNKVGQAAIEFLQIAGGTALITVEKFGAHGTNVGFFFICKGLGGIAEKLWREVFRRWAVSTAPIENESDIPASQAWMQRIGALGYVLGNNALGFLLAINDPFAYGAAGFVFGSLDSSTACQFQTRIIKDEGYLFKEVAKIQKVISRIIIPGGMATFFVFSFLGSSAKGTTAMASFLSGVMTGAGATIFANRCWKGAKSGIAMQTLRFATREGAVIFILPMMYILNQEKIGDMALEAYGEEKFSLAIAAWGLDGVSMGISFYNPISSNVPPAVTALLARYLFKQLEA